MQFINPFRQFNPIKGKLYGEGKGEIGRKKPPLPIILDEIIERARYIIG